MWVTRDKQGYLVLFSFSKPERDEENGIWRCKDNKCCEIPDKGFEDVKWNNEPLEIDLEILYNKAYWYDADYHRNFGIWAGCN